MRNLVSQFFELGWCRFETDPVLLDWVHAAVDSARETLQDPQNAKWHRYQDTWFAGVNVLPNDAQAAIAGSGPLRGKAVDFITSELGLVDFAWDRAQVSVCFPGYPQRMEGESEGKARYRRERDAAHLDGLLPEGPERRRHLREPHGFVLGIPMVEFDPGASPFIIWEGSHEIIRQTFSRRFADLEPQHWGDEDVTDIYHAVRSEIFERCRRVEIHAQPGEAYLAHRLSLHGMAPWQEGARAGPDGRMICYFRPNTFGPYDWLHQP